MRSIGYGGGHTRERGGRTRCAFRSEQDQLSACWRLGGDAADVERRTWRKQADAPIDGALFLDPYALSYDPHPDPPPFRGRGRTERAAGSRANRHITIPSPP